MVLKTDYTDFIPPAGGRVYQLTTVDAVTQKYNIADVTEYTQEGDAFGAVDINATNNKANALDTEQHKNTLSTAGLTYTGCTYNGGGYVKIGNLVIVNIRVALTAGATNPLVISGLPAPVASNNANYVPAEIQILVGACYAGAVFSVPGGDPPGSVRAYGTFASGQSMLINAVYVAA